jgi:predicted unusual protein kinase regulating ubiquinone biosynthesis (AarF/ABC1/UbiB family)
MTVKSSEDNPTVVGKLKRYANVSTKMTRIMTKLAGQRYFGTDVDQERHALEMKEALGDLKGPLMKVAQLLSTIPDALPPAYTQELSQLQSNAPPMSWVFVKRRMKAELGLDWQSKFKFFEQDAAAAASLGQIHRANSLKGETLACKLQYSDMQSVVAADLKQLKILLKLYESYDKAVFSDNIHEEISDRLREELDYILEACHIKLFEKMLKSVKTVHVPKVYEDLSTKRLLTMSWLEGEPLLKAKEHPLKDRNIIARNMFQAWYVPFYRYGIIHGDPHLGNYTICKNNDINLLDFGCVRIFEPKFVEGVINLYFALLNDDEELAVSAYRSWGFQNLSKDLVEVLNIWARFLYSPLMEDRKRLIEETSSGVYGREIASKVHDELRRVGGVLPPKEFVFMDRAAIGLGSVFLHLKAELNWYQEFHTLIEDFHPDKLAKSQEKVLRECGL